MRTIDSLYSHALKYLENYYPIVFLPVLLMIVSGCLKEDFPVIQDITKGSKWNLRIGDSYDNIYQSLQELGIEKEFYSVVIVGRTAMESPAEIQDFLPYYNALTIQNTVGRVDRLLVGLDSSRVTELYAGGAMLDSVDHWPEQYTDGAVIRQGDSFEELQMALEALHSLEEYMTYRFIFPDKPLDLAFDPDMKNYAQWYFTFDDATDSSGIQGTSQVRLYFENGKLVRIHHVYNENEIVI